MRGPAHVGSWAPPSFAKPEPDLYARIAAMNAADPVIGPAIAEGLRDRGFSGGVLAGVEKPKNAYGFPALAGMAGKLLAAADGPRVAALELGGWDTHAGQMRRLEGPLGQLDAGLGALKEALGAVWGQTAVLVMTEFGRTARMNGTNGTDHGTGTVGVRRGRTCGRRAGAGGLAGTGGGSPVRAAGFAADAGFAGVGEGGCWSGIWGCPAGRWARCSRGAGMWQRRGGCCGFRLVWVSVWYLCRKAFP